MLSISCIGFERGFNIRAVGFAWRQDRPPREGLFGLSLRSSRDGHVSVYSTSDQKYHGSLSKK